MNNLFIFGDSITHGEFDTEGGGWAERLKTHVYAKRLNGEITDLYVYPLGIPAEDTAGLEKRLMHEIEVRLDPGEASGVVLATGINDSKLLKDTKTNLVPFDDFSARYEKFLVDLKARDIRVWCVGLTRANETAPRSSKNTYFLNAEIERYDTKIQELATQYGVPYIPMHDVFGIDYSLFVDSVHPTAEGHKRMFERMKEHLEEASII